MSFESEALAAMPDGMLMSAWWQSRSVPRSTAFKLARIAGIEPHKVRQEGSRAPVNFLDQEMVAKLDALHAKLREGKTLAQLEGALAAMRQPRSSQAALSDHGHPIPPEEVLHRLQVGDLAMATGLPLSTAEVAWVLGARPGGDVVVRGRVVARRQGRNCWTLEPSGAVSDLGPEPSMDGVGPGL